MRALLKKLETAFGSAVQVLNFGRSEGLIVEVSAEQMADVCSWLRMEESFRLDFLESFTAFESRGKLHFSAFLRSTTIGHALVVRAAVDVPNEKEIVEFSSLTRIWPQAASFESELAPLFGVSFVRGRESSVKKDFGAFDGFPMRKHFTWGAEGSP